MSPRRRHNHPPLLLDLYACYLLPAYTLLFAGSVEWFSTNFSLRAALSLDHYCGFILWGFLATGYFLVLLSRLAGALSTPGLLFSTRAAILTACCCLTVAIIIPYLPDRLPGPAALHTLLAFSSCVLLMAILLLLLLAFQQKYSGPYRKLLAVWFGIVLCCGVLFLPFGHITTALEVFFTLSTVLLTRSLWLHRPR